MNEIYYWEYELKPRAALNARSGIGPRRGALVKIGEGHGCIHPWPELGDAPLEQQLNLLHEGESAYTPLLLAATECAKVDGLARQEGVSLFRDVVPKSHWLVIAGDDPETAKNEGFTIAKLKVAQDLDRVRKEMERWAAFDFSLRLDCNECLPKGSFLKFWLELPSAIRESVELVEDPEQWDEGGWIDLRNAGVPIAVDREAMTRYRLGDVFVDKPAFFTGFPNANAKFFVTSYMDHAIGQMYAAWRASELLNAKNRLTCGLLTHRCYESDSFFECLQVSNTRLLPVEGTGLGFDNLLERLPWKRLS